MKYFVRFFVITLLVLLCTNAQADSSQIRFINLKVILNDSKAGKEAQDFLKESAKANINKFKETEDSLKQQETDLISKKNFLSKEDYKKMADNLRKNVRGYQKERDSKLQKISKLRSEARSKLISEIKITVIQIPRHHNKIIKIEIFGKITDYRILCKKNNNDAYNDWQKADFKVNIIGYSCKHTDVVKKSFNKQIISLLPGGPFSADPIFIDEQFDYKKKFQLK